MFEKKTHIYSLKINYLKTISLHFKVKYKHKTFEYLKNKRSNIKKIDDKINGILKPVAFDKRRTRTQKRMHTIIVNIIE